MPLRHWLRGRRKDLPELVRQALAQARAGEAEAAGDRFAGRQAEALGELLAMGEPVDTGWLQLAARLQYRSGRPAEAAASAEQALGLQDDAATWHLLGRIRLYLEDPAADQAFDRAADLDPDHFVRPYRVSRNAFQGLAEAALSRIPASFQASLANTMIVVDDLPPLDTVREGEDPDLLGLYEGATVLEHGLPERIVLYQRNHENVCASIEELAAEVDETMRHEVGHHFGMEEDELPY